MITRTLKVFGTSEPNTHIQVYVDNVLVKDGEVDGNLLFAFTTDVQIHGKATVIIRVLTGSIVLGHTTATYPASFGYCKGTVTFKQPIKQPMMVFDGNQLQDVLVGTTIRESYQYDHLMMNGPSEMIVEPSIEVWEGIDLDVGELNSDIKNVKNIVPSYNYLHHRNDFSDSSLVDLKQYVLDNWYNG